MKKENSIEFEVCGDYALFSDVITRVGGEKSSYFVPTYEALKGILHSIYWKPTIIWVIDKAKVLNLIGTESKSIRTMKYNKSDECDRSFYTYLKNVRYAVKAHFVWNQNRPELEKDRIEDKHYFMAKRALERGGRRDIFLGTRECSGYVSPCEFGSLKSYYADRDEIDFGNMFHGITYPDEAFLQEDKGYLTVRFWNCKMKNGIIEFPHPNLISEKSKRHIRKMGIKKFSLDKSIKNVEKEFSSLNSEGKEDKNGTFPKFNRTL